MYCTSQASILSLRVDQAQQYLFHINLGAEAPVILRMYLIFSRDPNSMLHIPPFVAGTLFGMQDNVRARTWLI